MRPPGPQDGPVSYWRACAHLPASPCAPTPAPVTTTRSPALGVRLPWAPRGRTHGAVFLRLLCVPQRAPKTRLRRPGGRERLAAAGRSAGRLLQEPPQALKRGAAGLLPGGRELTPAKLSAGHKARTRGSRPPRRRDSPDGPLCPGKSAACCERPVPLGVCGPKTDGSRSGGKCPGWCTQFRVDSPSRILDPVQPW